MRLLIFFLLVSIPFEAFSECIANGFLRGSEIPKFEVVSKRTLLSDWQEYSELIDVEPVISRLTEAPEISSHCLVDFKNESSKNTEALVVALSCDEIGEGEIFRVTATHYCIEFLTDFYSWLPYRHGYIEENRTHY